MTITQAKKEFKQVYFDFIQEHKADKIMLNYEWRLFCDSLVKSGFLTQKQWQNLTNLF